MKPGNFPQPEFSIGQLRAALPAVKRTSITANRWSFQPQSSLPHASQIVKLFSTYHVLCRAIA
jgi:hypothetical protein